MLPCVLFLGDIGFQGTGIQGHFRLLQKGEGRKMITVCVGRNPFTVEMLVTFLLLKITLAFVYSLLFFYFANHYLPTCSIAKRVNIIVSVSKGLEHMLP